MSIGFGLGWALGAADLQAPDSASVRFRLDSGLTLEPIVRLATHGQSTADGDFKDAQNEVLLGSNVRIPLKSRGKVDLVGQIGGAFGVFISDPDGDNNNQTTTTFVVDYGLGVDYWFNQNWCLSFTARNPFFSLERISQEASSDLTATNTDVGLIWNPGIDAALHLFY